MVTRAGGRLSRLKADVRRIQVASRGGSLSAQGEEGPEADLLREAASPCISPVDLSWGAAR